MKPHDFIISEIMGFCTNGQINHSFEMLNDLKLGWILALAKIRDEYVLSATD